MDGRYKLQSLWSPFFRIAVNQTLMLMMSLDTSVRLREYTEIAALAVRAELEELVKRHGAWIITGKRKNLGWFR